MVADSHVTGKEMKSHPARRGQNWAHTDLCILSPMLPPGQLRTRNLLPPDSPAPESLQMSIFPPRPAPAPIMEPSSLLLTWAYRALTRRVTTLGSPLWAELLQGCQNVVSAHSSRDPMQGLICARSLPWRGGLCSSRHPACPSRSWRAGTLTRGSTLCSPEP